MIQHGYLYPLSENTWPRLFETSPVKRRVSLCAHLHTHEMNSTSPARTGPAASRLGTKLGELFLFSRKIESSYTAGAIPDLSNSQVEPSVLTAALSKLLAQLTAGVEALNQAAYSIDILHARLPAEQREQLELYRLGVIARIMEASVLSRRIAMSLQPKIAKMSTRAPNEK